MQYKVVWLNGASVRTGPSTGHLNVRNSDGSNKILIYDTIIDVVEDNIPDSVSPTNINKKWVRIADNQYMASDYPDGLLIPRKRMEFVSVPPVVEPPTTTDKVEVLVKINDVVVYQYP